MKNKDKTDATKKQSQQAYRQWSAQWRDHAKKNSKFPMKNMGCLAYSGIGKAILCVGNGFSFEQNIETIKKYKKNVDILCCDKTLGHLINHGIKPTYCFVADANVNYEKYMQPFEDQLDKTILFSNVCANPKWAHNGNWKDKFFFVFKDVMGYEREFCELSGCPNVITAGTNVSNMMVVVLTQCDNDKHQNLFGYDKIVLIGYDYNWKPTQNYYAFDHDGGGKRWYMRHIFGLSTSGDIIYSSNNLAGSAEWLTTYCKAFKLPVVQCSPDSLFMMNAKPPSLEEQLKYRFRTSDCDLVIQQLKQKNHLEAQMKKIDDKLKAIGKNHHMAHLATL